MTAVSGKLSRRQEYAQATRRAIVDAARRLFTERGYFATKVDDIASEARVAPATVYAVTGGKQGLLAELITTWTTDPIVEATVSNIVASSDPAQIIRDVASAAREMREQFEDVIRLLLTTAPLTSYAKRPPCTERPSSPSLDNWRSWAPCVQESTPRTPSTCSGSTSATPPTSPCTTTTAGHMSAPSTGWPTRPAANSSAANNDSAGKVALEVPKEAGADSPQNVLSQQGVFLSRRCDRPAEFPRCRREPQVVSDEGGHALRHCAGTGQMDGIQGAKLNRAASVTLSTSSAVSGMRSIPARSSLAAGTAASSYRRQARTWLSVGPRSVKVGSRHPGERQPPSG
jgi:AcrR family transcriptional regulator